MRNKDPSCFLLSVSAEVVLFPVLNQHGFRYICNVAEDNKMKLIQAAILKCCPSYVIVHREKAM